MAPFLFRTFFLFLALLVGGSFFSVLIEPQYVPQLLLITSVVFTFVLGFERSWPWVVFAGLVQDSFSYSPVGFHVVQFMAISYALSLISRRFLMEHRVWGWLVSSLFIVGAVAISVIVTYAYATGEVFTPPMRYSNLSRIGIASLASVPLYVILLIAFQRGERFISYYRKPLLLDH